MKSSELRQASVSDIHLGHKKTPTTEIIQNLFDAFPDTEETGKLDIIWFGGDLFDGPMSLYDPDVISIKIWAYAFLRMCKKRNIVVRILEGTPSHDWKQSRILATINEQAQIGVDLKYVDTLSIEYIERFGIHVLYVPDEWTPETDDTWTQVTQLLQTYGLEQVDYAIMHGSFAYQLPAFVNVPVHQPERYLSIVRHYIFVGHIHKASQFERILANGSFDRLAHGEEEPKGHWRVTVRPDHTDDIVFVENTGAKIYKTVDCTELTVEDALKKLECVKELPEGSHIRIAAGKSDPILTSLDVLRQQYPLFHWTSKVKETATVQAKLFVDMRESFQQVNITRENIEGLLLKRLPQLSQNSRVLERSQQRLLEMI